VDQATANVGEFLMSDLNYYGWRVLNDPMYIRLMEKGLDVTKQDQDTMSKIIEQHIPNRRTVLDIGCHYGFFTKFLSDKFDQVHAFDFPNDVLDYCKHNLKDCKNITIHDHGIGSVNATVSTNDWSYRHERRAPLGMHIDPTGMGPQYPIKSVDSLGLKEIDLMMVDTEGYEIEVLKGARKTIERDRPVIVLEFHRRPKNRIDNLTRKFGYDLATLQNYVERLGYRSWGYLNIHDQVFLPTA
jgi:FkbM family methyltransferase|tara:strand:+ start:151 stop:876 length:726 start_codon:yes stop_codon:yes gene_type:complete